MRPFTREDLRVLLSAHDAPCLTLYMPRGAGGPAEHALRFRKLLKDAERSGDRFDRTALRQVVAKVADLDTPDFWNDLRTTLAVFASPDFLETFRLGEPVAEATLVADTFLTKPLVKYLQGDVRYYLLTATRENVTLWEGGRESLDVVRVPEMPRGLRDLETARQKEATLGARQAGFGASVFYGGGGTDGKSDLRQLFRAVDRALMKVTHDERTPLILATFEQYHALFHEVSKNPALLDEGIHGDPEQTSLDQLRSRALALLAPRREAALRALKDEYAIALNHKRATNYLPNIAAAAIQGRVKTLLIEDGKPMPGVLDRATGAVRKEDAPGAGDLLDDVGELVLGAGGDVFVLPRAMMPTDVGVAAIYRY